MNNIKNVAAVVGKVGLASATVMGIGWAILTQDVSPEAAPGAVAPAQADIVDFGAADGTEFTRAMASLGLQPRAYDMNGNVMYFASGYADNKSPYEVMDIVQDEMVFHGVNSKNWLAEEPVAVKFAKSGHFQEKFDPADGFSAEKLEALENNGISQAMLSGELVPLVKEKNYVVVGGVNPKRDVAEVVDQFQKDGARSPIRDYLGGYRFVDATEEPGENRTMITAVWTEDNFDAKKMDNRAFKQQPADPNVPACVGCEREFRMQSLQKDEPFRQNKWTARNAGLDETYSFYQRAMATRGWSDSGVQAKLDLLSPHFPEINTIPGRTLNMTKDGRTMTITLIQAPNGGTEVYSSEQFEDTQGALMPGVEE